MNIWACVKRVPDPEGGIETTPDGLGLDEDAVRWMIDPGGEVAVEQALRFKEALETGSVTAIRVGPLANDDPLIAALAMGADEAVLVEAPHGLDAASTAAALHQTLMTAGTAPDLILCGDRALDQGNGQVPYLLAARLGWPVAGSALGLGLGRNSLILEREGEGGARETYRVPLPAVVAVSPYLVQPRYTALPLIKRARSRPIRHLDLVQLGIGSDSERVRVEAVEPAADRVAGEIFEIGDERSMEQIVEALIQRLRREAGVLE